jgi:predicted nucleotide-binding protein
VASRCQWHGSLSAWRHDLQLLVYVRGVQTVSALGRGPSWFVCDREEVVIGPANHVGQTTQLQFADRPLMSMKPSCFVGSSSESKKIAEAVQQRLHEVLDVTLWTQVGFCLNQPPLTTLLQQAWRYDYAIFVFAPDDQTRLREQTMLSTRDNVVFELGLFMAALGPDRCFYLVPKTEQDFRIASDLNGLTIVIYDPTSHDGNLDAALGVPCSKISQAVGSACNLSGEWKLYIDGSTHTEPNGVMFLTCAGERAAARLQFRMSKDGDQKVRNFRYEGRYVAGQFALTFAQDDAEDQIVGSMVIRANSSRTEMYGQTVFWHHDSGEFASETFSLRR